MESNVCSLRPSTLTRDCGTKMSKTTENGNWTWLNRNELSFLTGAVMEQPSYNPIPDIPTNFWMSRVVDIIPTTQFYRRRLMREVLDVEHNNICNNSKFHVHPEESCLCISCNEHAHAYHSRYCQNS